MKGKKTKKDKVVDVQVVNQPLDVSVSQRPYLLTLFEGREIAAHSNALGPLGGLNLTGYTEYRLTLHLVGVPGTPFTVREMFGPAGAVDQVAFDVGSGQIGPQGVLDYRARFDIFGPKNFFIQINNLGDEPLQINGTLYAVR